ncbi:hypothetical protein WJ07_12360 [Burkholderia vietnamiensis]|uniref:hypothetical protein n=1 Tax=Burkholderia vietnamiensis TaxID=60552 RepID=UPI000757D762|nr:hypothetical protein [Burkholderia vietnamiensis]KVF25218.1 hypothetical protein WJ07_12360 [Burkholderia vietnamiensis]
MKDYRGHTATVVKGHVTTTVGAQELPARYVEVWGDTVDFRHLGWSIALGIGISTAAFFAGKSAISSYVADAAIARAYAMLVGLAGCLVAGAICARLFEPKRHVVEQTSDESERICVLEQLAAEYGGLGCIDDLSSAAHAELSELGLLDLFAAQEKAAASGVRIDRAAEGGSK